MNTPAASPWAGLGRRGDSTPAGEPSNEDDFERPIVQRTVAAAEAQPFAPVTTLASGFPWPWPSAGRAEKPADEPAAQEKPMPRRRTAETTPQPRDSQLRIATLLQAGAQTRDALAELLPDFTAKRLTQTLFNLHEGKRIKKVLIEGGTAYELTATGVRWLAAKGIAAASPETAPEAPGRVPAKRAKPGQKVRRPRAASAEIAQPAGTALAIRAFEPVVERSFRCAAYSDGGFFLSKNGVQIELTAAEHAEMLRYEERMAEQPA